MRNRLQGSEQNLSDSMLMLLSRLEQHLSFQSAQRLCQNKLVEECLASMGLEWFMKIDKMDQSRACVFLKYPYSKQMPQHAHLASDFS